MSDGGKTPIRSVNELKALGYRLAIWPAMAALSASYAMERAMLNLKENGTSLGDGPPLFSFDEFCKMVGFGAVWQFEEKWKDVLEKREDKASS
jgi:2-methylisocitrate lyase-like PEP mutase family enzyme